MGHHGRLLSLQGQLGARMDNRKITIDDVANALKVSKTTVSRAISGKGRVGAETRDRILKYIEEHNYVPSAMAKGLAQQRTYNIGITVPVDFTLVDLPFFQQCLMGVCDYAGSEDYDVLVSLTSIDDISQLERLVNNRKVDGVVLTRTLTHDLPAELLLKKKVPFVSIGSSKNPGVIQVDNDHESACWELTTRLIGMGIKRFALLCDNGAYVVTKSRMQGFLNALEEAGLPESNGVIFDDTTDENMDMILERVLKSDIECILCMDDSICVKVLDKLKKKNLEVPEDIKVASFYNSSVLERNVPSITSLDFDARELGRVACKTLIQLIAGETVPARSLLGYEISMKESTKTILGKEE